MNEILEIRVEDFSSDALKHHLERLAEIVSGDNVDELRSMVRGFIEKIELHPKVHLKAKKWKRRVSIRKYIRAFTMILVASPTGLASLWLI